MLGYFHTYTHIALVDWIRGRHCPHPTTCRASAPDTAPCECGKSHANILCIRELGAHHFEQLPAHSAQQRPMHSAANKGGRRCEFCSSSVQKSTSDLSVWLTRKLKQEIAAACILLLRHPNTQKLPIRKCQQSNQLCTRNETIATCSSSPTVKRSRPIKSY